MSGFVPPNPVVVALYLFAEGAILLTLTLLLSTRLSAIATGVVAHRALRRRVARRRRRVARHGVQDQLAARRSATSRATSCRPTGSGAGAIYYLEPQSFVAQRLDELARQRQPVLRPVTADVDLPHLGRRLVPRGPRGRGRELRAARALSAAARVPWRPRVAVRRHRGRRRPGHPGPTIRSMVRAGPAGSRRDPSTRARRLDRGPALPAGVRARRKRSRMAEPTAGGER